MTEHDLQNLIRLELSAKGYKVFRANVGKVKLEDGRWFDVGLPKGFSDLFCIKDGKIHFLEVKVDKNKPSAEQINFIEQMKKQGCVAGVVYSLDDVFELLNIENGMKKKP